ncbi:hypothetical protein TWF696_008036 [Orbilia brochopaga]|uniref:Rhodopsin domain-containing protein n=1 Tax=Orbilia brochopaga TaxID=3140254 RepID=A0AAV9UPC1_9PEZI
MNYFQIRYGTGDHIDTVTTDELLPTLRYWFAYQIIYPLVLLFIKLSILSFYLGISPQKWYRYAVNSVLAFVVAWTVAVIFAYIFECPDPSRAWSPEFPQGCVNLSALYYSSASINIATDLVILLLPIPVLHRLQIDRRRKVALIAIFSVGGIAVAGSVAQLWAVWKYQHTVDVSYDAILILLFSHIEITLAMMCSCAPALKPLFKGFSTPFNSRAGESKVTNSTTPGPAGAALPSAGGSALATAPDYIAIPSTSLARNRAVFENLTESPQNTPDLERRVVEITGGTPYYTPPLEFQAKSNSDSNSNSSPSPDGDENPQQPANTALRLPQGNRIFQHDEGYGFRRMQSAPTFRTESASSTINAPPPVQISKLAGEYTATCSSSQSLDRSSDETAVDRQSYFGFMRRPSIWRRHSFLSNGRQSAAESLSDTVSPSADDLEVNVEQEIRIDYESMTREEQQRWEQKRSRLDAVDSLW